MGFPIVMPGGSGNLNTLAAGTQTAGKLVGLQNVVPATLSCEFALTAATSTIQLFGEWQISDDGTTWKDVKVENGALAVVLTTGTAAIVRVVLGLPQGCYGAKFARAVVRNQVVTGAAGDLYALTYRWAPQ
jgi:hypothetical protein